MKESLILTACYQYLLVLENMGKAYVYRSNSFAGHLTRANGSRGWINNAKRGCPDLTLLFRGKYIAIEVKNETGRQSEAQKEAQRQIEQCGGLYWIIRSVEELQNKLKELERTLTT